MRARRNTLVRARHAPPAAALITFLVTLSGVVVAGVGSAFWGVLAGALALFVQQYGKSHFSHPPSA